MVFEKITLFEPHFDGATFDARFGDDHEPTEQDTTDRMDTEPEKSGRRRVFVPLVASLALAVTATVLARRFFRSDDSEQTELDESIERTVD